MGSVYTKVSDERSLRPGDHICIWDYSRWPITYQHHGIVWASGDSFAHIKVCHVWSPLEGFQEAQADSCFRISTLEEFLHGRRPSHLRLVEYHTSGLRDLLAKWGEVHRGKSDLPEVVLARCKFLLGLGRGDFNIVTQNCEHAAHWCKTGRQWSKQIMTTVRGRVPFEKRLAKEDVDTLEREIEAIKEVSRSVVDSVLRLRGAKVLLRVRGNQYVRVEPDGVHVGVATQREGAPPVACTAFRLECYSKGYNCVKVSFFHEESGRYMFSRSTLSCLRDLRMKRANCLRGTTGLKWEYSSTGHLHSMNQHRRYIGVRGDGLLVDVGSRCEAAYVEFVPVADDRRAPEQGAYVPPDITKTARAYNHEKQVGETQSRSMCEFEQEVRSAQQTASL